MRCRHWHSWCREAAAGSPLLLWTDGGSFVSTNRRRRRFERLAAVTKRLRSDVGEKRRKRDDDERCPGGVDRQVRSLPTLQHGKRGAARKKTRIHDSGPREIHEQDDVLAERRDPIRREAELRNARRDGNKRERIDQQRADDEQQLQAVEQVGGRIEVARRGGVEHEAHDEDEEQVKCNQHVPLDVDWISGPRHRREEGEQEDREKW